uniref:Guanylate cyclase domain-containing protein n=1 Tax=Mucochytrium quahogii TaxID=96639 RepID=A0A7S2W6W7_9STRA|mmetsp:Transcript_9463/g.17845  ORF Transcript_9463/g.17845 Transcript_9463/m.17845 type:complete len:1291 (+) Transcript_9463:509-4381(+)
MKASFRRSSVMGMFSSDGARKTSESIAEGVETKKQEDSDSQRVGGSIFKSRASAGSSSGESSTSRRTWSISGEEVSRPILDFLPMSVSECPNGQEMSVPRIDYREGAVMFIDISRFSNVSDQLSSFDSRGPERVACSLNGCFSQIVRLVSKSGGDVFKFAGDALIVTWLVDINNEQSCPTLSNAAQRSIQCGMDIQETLPSISLFKDVKWTFRIGIGSGPLSIIHCGGGPAYPDHIEFVAVGPALCRAFEAEKVASPSDDVICSLELLETLGDYFGYQKIDGTSFAKVTEQKMFIKKRNRFFSPDAGIRISEQAAKMYLPIAIHSYAMDLEGVFGRSKDWVSELRQVTVLFIYLGFESFEDAHTSKFSELQVARLHEAICKVQEAIYDYSGTIIKLNMDDKGLTAIGVFGLPPSSHDNDATRGVLASLRIVGGLKSQMNLTTSIGITSNICFCGVIGHRGGRMEYTVIGDSVNLAARLMQASISSRSSRVFTDKQTRNLVRVEVEFSPREKEIDVKGKVEKIKVFSPSLAKRVGSFTRRLSVTFNSAVELEKPVVRRCSSHEVDWEDEWKSQVERYGKKIAQEFKGFRMNLIHAEASSTEEMTLGESIPGDDVVTIVLGEIGSGKSHLLAEIYQHKTYTSSDSGIENLVLGTAANPFAKGALSRQFSIWSDMVSQCFPQNEVENKNELILKWLKLAGATELKSISALNPILGTSFEGTTEGNETNIISQLLVDILVGVSIASGANVVCLIDDGTYMDKECWWVVSCLARTRPKNVSVVIAAEPFESLLKRGGHQNASNILFACELVKLYGIRQETLPPLTYAEIVTLVQNKLDIVTAPEELIDILLLTSLGNPLFVLEILSQMEDDGTLVVDKALRVCTFLESHGNQFSKSMRSIGRTSSGKRKSSLGLGLRSPSPSSTPSCNLFDDSAQTMFSTENLNSSKSLVEQAISNKFNLFKKQDMLVSKTNWGNQKLYNLMVALDMEPPMSIWCVFGSWLSVLTVKQHILLKLSTFALTLDSERGVKRSFHKMIIIGAMVVLDSNSDEIALEKEFLDLENRGFLKPTDEEGGSKSPNMFEFVHWLLPYVLRLRTLSSQRSELVKQLLTAREKHEKEVRTEFIHTSNNLLRGKLKDGMVLIHKNPEEAGEKKMRHRRRHSLGSIWKKRYACLFSNRIEFYSDHTMKKHQGTLHLENSEVTIEDGLAAGRTQTIKLSASRWEKPRLGVQKALQPWLANTIKNFYFCPVEYDNDEMEDWLYKVRLAIESTQEQKARSRHNSLLPKAGSRRHSLLPFS